MGILSQFQLDGKVALVTGSGQGIGRAFALALAEAGADVVVADLNAQTAAAVVKEIEQRGRKAVAALGDIGKEEDAKSMVAAATERLGGLDILVNNANAGGKGDLDWIGRNLKALIVFSRLAVEAMKKRGRGKIVNVASISGSTVNVRGFSYCVGKAGVVHLTRCMAAEWACHNVNVNCISPSYTLSPARRDDNEEMRQRIRSVTPMGWYERPEDMCGTLIYLVSDASNYLTGQEIIVDGGHLLSDWLLWPPPARVAPPLVSPEQEAASLIHDLDVLGVKHDGQGFVAKEERRTG